MQEGRFESYVASQPFWFKNALHARKKIVTLAITCSTGTPSIMNFVENSWSVGGRPMGASGGRSG
jgi:hypothetical protein